ncbi:uroporphyrinogen-III synthase [Metabacillus idriensis]|uniref:uroporphyrinogen-III synthase n=1 Tax=Metabacillus idriensis TaxID=324768 RepID=UPI002814691C|nr:uroporphyrinogen-III synthase [Metabacillus idriensis]MDR0136666.1 uroporphyrinogen-III synthase [Metabacillus idriensis]
MGNGLEGKRIVIAGSRKTDEISTLIEKQGGIPLVRSLQGTVFLAEEQVEPDLRKFIQEGADWVIFTTGIGTETLLNLARKLGEEEAYLKKIQQAQIASRGYKTFAALKKLGLAPAAKDDDGTTRGLVRALENEDLNGKKVMVQLHGETAPALISFLEEKGASVLQVLPYQHIAPDEKAVSMLCDEMQSHQVDAVCFTAAIQVREFFTYVKKNECLQEILHAFNTDVLPVAVGKITAEALTEEGVHNPLAPDLERMGAMIIELAKYYEEEKIK